ncbi:DUF4328 domain-containing protein [Streptomyces sp. NBC_00322]|uniref:DUF4328 domain-containing protein n=1 Tax=Streptomyces sp. NBC_00322 TaxID=2975712 RepID=UPI002E28ED9B|nr:DUF4328 domain-containing protein [Streptomyces sp. NBC_00322]
MVDGTGRCGISSAGDRLPYGPVSATPLGRGVFSPVGGRSAMLCSKCRTDAAATAEGLCQACSVGTVDITPPGPWAGGVLRSPVGISYAVVALLCLVVATDLFSLVAAVGLRNLTATAYSDTDLEQATSLMDTAGVTQGIAQLATLFVFLGWFQRARNNAGVFAPDLQRRGAGWATGGWFVPFGNLYIPRAITADIWAASRRDPYGTGKQEPHTVVNAWWTAWLATNLINPVAGRQYASADTPDAFRAGADVFVLGGILDIVAALLAIVVVRRLTRMQNAKAAHRRSGSRRRPRCEPARGVRAHTSLGSRRSQQGALQAEFQVAGM